MDRSLLEKCLNEDLNDYSLIGCCRLSQEIIDKLLNNIGLNSRYLTILGTIDEYDAEEHGFNTVSIPVIKENGDIREKNFLIDVTYRQFFMKDMNYTDEISNYSSPGYCCLNFKGGNEFAQKILENGFIELTLENAKIYGDSFLLYSENLKYNVEFNEFINNKSAEKYYNNFINNDMPSFPHYYEEGELEEDYGIKSLDLKNKYADLTLRLGKETLDEQKDIAFLDKIFNELKVQEKTNDDLKYKNDSEEEFYL